MDLDILLIAMVILGPMAVALLTQLMDQNLAEEKKQNISLIACVLTFICTIAYSYWAPNGSNSYELMQGMGAGSQEFSVAVSFSPGQEFFVAALALLMILALFGGSNTSGIRPILVLAFGNWALCASSPMSALVITEFCLLGVYLFSLSQPDVSSASLLRWLVHRMCWLAICILVLWSVYAIFPFQKTVILGCAAMIYVASVVSSGLSVVAPAGWYLQGALSIIGIRLLLLFFDGNSMDSFVSIAGLIFFGLLGLLRIFLSLISGRTGHSLNHALTAAWCILLATYSLFMVNEGDSAGHALWLQTSAILLVLVAYWQSGFCLDKKPKVIRRIAICLSAISVWFGISCPLMICAGAANVESSLLAFAVAALASACLGYGIGLGVNWDHDQTKDRFHWRKNWTDIFSFFLFGVLLTKAFFDFNGSGLSGDWNNTQLMMLTLPFVFGLVSLMIGVVLGIKAVLPRHSTRYDAIFSDDKAGLPIAVRLVDSIRNILVVTSARAAQSIRTKAVWAEHYFSQFEDDFSGRQFWQGIFGMGRSISLYFRSLNTGYVAIYWFISVLVCAVVGVVCVFG